MFEIKTAMYTLSALSEGLIISGFAALLAALGWLISSQVATNKSLSKGLTDAVSEFRIAVSIIQEKDSSRTRLCEFTHRKADECHKMIEERIVRIEEHIEAVAEGKPKRKSSNKMP